MNSNLPHEDTTTYRPPLGHRGPCGTRRRCYRPACRAEFGDVQTVEIVDRVAIFFCHHLKVPIDPIVLGMLA